VSTASVLLFEDCRRRSLIFLFEPVYLLPVSRLWKSLPVSGPCSGPRMDVHASVPTTSVRMSSERSSVFISWVLSGAMSRQAASPISRLPLLHAVLETCGLARHESPSLSLA
jgi:hypothetical protein